MALGKLWLVGAVTLAFAVDALAPAQAASRLSEKNIIKRLVIKKKPTTRQRTLRRSTTRRTTRTIQRNTTRRKTTTRRRIFKSEPIVKRRKKLTIRKTRLKKFKIRRTREERRSLTRRKTLRRLLTKKRSRKRTIQKRIAFPPPGIEIDSSSAGGSGGKTRPRKPRPPKNSGGSGRTKWVSTSPRPKKKWKKKKTWNQQAYRPSTKIVRQTTRPVRRKVVRPVKVVTTRVERDQIQDIVQTEGLPQIDIEIYFDYNSATVRAQSMPDIGTLGRALRNKQLAGSQFMIIGHTDASGSDSYNLRLSEARAQAVRNFLVNVFGLEGERFFPMGYGEEQLKLRHLPDHAQNRRVQIVNIGGGQDVAAAESVADEEDVAEADVEVYEDGVPDDQ